MSKLVVIPCGKAKIWSREPSLGPTPARDAYIGAPFKVNRECAERSRLPWVILSAKYGFLEPDTLIEDYNATFKDRKTNPISVDALREQVVFKKLNLFDEIVVLGGKEYRAVIISAFSVAPVKLSFPLAGLPLGKAMAAAKSVDLQTED